LTMMSLIMGVNPSACGLLTDYDITLIAKLEPTGLRKIKDRRRSATF
jgi:hypothetical protein